MSVKTASGIVGAAALIGLATSCAAGSPAATMMPTVAGATVTQTQAVPGPTVTVTQTVPAPPPPARSLIAKFKGKGTQVTPTFNVPPAGAYIVEWAYAGNTGRGGGGMSFSINSNMHGFSDLPDEIAVAGQGSTEVSQVSSTDSLNVKATGSWTITITAP